MKLAAGDAQGAKTAKEALEVSLKNMDALRSKFDDFSKRKDAEDAEDYENEKRKARADADGVAAGAK